MQKGRGVIEETNVTCDLGAYRLTNNSRVATGSSSQVLRNGLMEFIQWDDTKRSGPIKRTRSCDHWKVNIQNKKVRLRGLDGNSPTLYYFSNEDVGDHYFVLPSIPDLSSYHMEAMKFFKSGCTDNEMSLVVSLLEISEIKTLLPSLKKAWETIFRPRSSLLSHAKAYANTNLLYSFGIKPIVSDVMSLYNVFTSLQRRVTWLRKNQGKPVRVSFRKKLPSSTGVSVGTDNNYGKEWVSISEDREYHAFAVIQYDISQLSDLELKLRVLNRSFGITDFVSNAIERIPYSFLLNWVTNLGALLNGIPSVINLPLRFIDVGYSFKTTKYEEQWWRSKYDYQGECRFLLGTKRTTLFHRRPGLPITFPSIVADSDVSLNQLGLALSLLIQKYK